MNPSPTFAPFAIGDPNRSRARPAWLSRAGSALGTAIRAAAAARARREMLAFADRCESLQPQLAAELRAASAHLAAR